MKADKQKVLKLLHTAQGQLNGIEKMIENDEYCIEISNQLMASIAILKKANLEVLSAHLEHCVSHACCQDDKDDKINEVISILKRMN